jgi:hypothetical protein
MMGWRNLSKTKEKKVPPAHPQQAFIDKKK